MLISLEHELKIFIKFFGIVKLLHINVFLTQIKMIAFSSILTILTISLLVSMMNLIQ